MPAVHQAGAVVVRGQGASAEVLLVSAKKDPRQWIFPKGHVEPGESAAEAALREMREEGGVDGRIIRPIGVSTYESGKDRVKVSYFLVRYRKAVLTTEPANGDGGNSAKPASSSPSTTRAPSSTRLSVSYGSARSDDV